jgi:hypothetical protein
MTDVALARGSYGQDWRLLWAKVDDRHPLSKLAASSLTAVMRISVPPDHGIGIA